MAKTVLITGSSSGIGKAAVSVFAEAGWQVAATSRGPLPTAGSPKSAMSKVKYYVLDVTKPQSIAAAFTAVTNVFGSIDVVVNNAGYGQKGIFENLTDNQIRAQFETNVFGLMHVTKAALQVMRPRKTGTIIQVSSMGGRVTFPMYSIYHSSKWAVEGFSESLQYELRQVGITIKIIEPGVIKTNFYSNKKISTKPDSLLGYDNFINNSDSVTQNAGNNGVSPQVVAKTIFKAATDGSTKLRYSTGKPAPALLFARKLLPERMFFWLMRLGYKIKPRGTDI